jgi:hypothetical protein
MNEERRFRASYTVLRLWEQGKYDDAIKTYFHIGFKATPQMIEGRKYHEDWAREIMKTGKLPQVFGARQLTNPKCEQKYVIDLQSEKLNWLTLVGKFDCEEPNSIIEFKTGLTDSATYAGDMQILFYAILRKFLQQPAEKAEVYRYNQYTRMADMSIVWLTQNKLNIAADWIQTLSSDMFEYLIKNKLFEQLGGIK